MEAVPSKPKLVLIVVDSLRTDMLLRAVELGKAPNFARLLERGTLVPECVSSFPSVTPVASSEIVTGVGSDEHFISGMNWYHRVERRYVEYGSSLEATRTFGVFRALYDVVYNMNLGHLSHEAHTLFETLGDAGLRTACTPFLIYRGRRRHELSLEGVMRRLAVAADFRHAVWGPDELFYGELLRQPPRSLQADAGPAGDARRVLRLRRRRARPRRPLRLPALLAARQRPLLAPLRAAADRSTRSPTPTPTSAGSRRRREE